MREGTVSKVHLGEEWGSCQSPPAALVFLGCAWLPLVAPHRGSLSQAGLLVPAKGPADLFVVGLSMYMIRVALLFCEQVVLSPSLPSFLPLQQTPNLFEMVSFECHPDWSEEVHMAGGTWFPGGL